MENGSYFRTKFKVVGNCLDHSLNEFINLILAISKVTTFDKVIVLLAPSAGRCVKLEWPEEVVYLLENSAAGIDLKDHILNALYVVSLLQFSLNNKVVGDWNATSCMLNVIK